MSAPSRAQLGRAAALAAVAREAVTGRPQRLLWCVDLERDLGGADGEWSRMLMRFRDALDRQEMTPSRCHLAMVLRVRREGPTRDPVLVAVSVPYVADLTVMACAPPPAGTWRVADEPPRQTSAGHPAPPSWDREGDEKAARTLEGAGLPADFFFEGIPF